MIKIQGRILVALASFRIGTHGSYAYSDSWSLALGLETSSSASRFSTYGWHGHVDGANRSSSMSSRQLCSRQPWTLSWRRAWILNWSSRSLRASLFWRPVPQIKSIIWTIQTCTASSKRQQSSCRKSRYLTLMPSRWMRALAVPHTRVACQLRLKKKLTSRCIGSWRQTLMLASLRTKLTVMRLMMVVLIIGIARGMQERPPKTAKNSLTKPHAQWATRVIKRVITRSQMVSTCPELRSRHTQRASFSVCVLWMISTLIKSSAL